METKEYFEKVMQDVKLSFLLQNLSLSTKILIFAENFDK